MCCRFALGLCQRGVKSGLVFGLFQLFLDSLDGTNSEKLIQGSDKEYAYYNFIHMIPSILCASPLYGIYLKL